MLERRNSRAIRSLCEGALFLAFAILISYIEKLLLLTDIIPLPGIKPGFANIVSLYLVSRKRTSEAFVICVLRCFIMFLLFGNSVSLTLSLSGGCLAIIAMRLSKSCLSHGFTLITLSVIGATFFNTAQIVASSLFFGSAVFYYLPVLLFSAGITGFLTGFVARLSFDRLDIICKVGCKS